ncbi:M28 family metallopeptidase [Sphingomonas alpina]|uniref:M20/M25/M40 family metallo-hydrolase n=1 Tax=Sphingomonas alpina TaxID=653931 RepID=A0A7H0LIX1_9SPHN|nr:M28 family metallopeptidase [Sphingomonas alpina]QNQ09624.1 M20/M25/M40 family metallo-hydrolase [Sphingomonas alpina]
MFRVIGVVALAGLAGATIAQAAPVPQTAPAPTPTPAPAKRSAAAINAIVNAVLPDDQAAMKAHVMFLASDAMRGREAGSPEFDIAAQYVAAQFYAAGLRPAGQDGGYIQKVPLTTYKAADKGNFVLSKAGAPPQALVFGEDYTPGANPGRRETAIDAPVVFVGYGIVAPHVKRDDYAGVDVRGKIVAYFGGAPNSLQSEERAHFASPATKAVIAADHGAVGTIILDRPGLARGRSFATQARDWDEARTTWANPDGTGENAGAPGLGTISAAGAAKLFAGAKVKWEDMLKQANNSETRFKAVELPGTLTVALKTSFEPESSANVAGIIPGTDPKVGKEIVILSAHLDHIGVGKPDATGDTINNGAEDNAVGIASLIEEAKRFKASGKPPRRTIMFLAVTAEEKGLVGSDYFAKHPTVAKEAIVADVNLDMPLLTYRFEDMVVFGADRSTLGPIVSKAVAGVGVTMSPDPDPSQAIFVRSDHYRFVQQGIPSVFLWPGQAGAGKAAWAKFFADNYHQPSDEISLPIDWAQGIRFVDANYAIAREIADGDDRPRWNKGDFFGLLYKGYGAR